MPFNLSNIASWIANVRGISTTDQLEGGPLGVMNFGMQDLTSRTQWLYDRTGRQLITEIVAITGATSLTAADAGKSYACGGSSTYNVSLPDAATVPVGQFFHFVHNNESDAGVVYNIVRAGSQLIAMGGRTRTQAQLKPTSDFFLVSTGTGWRLIGSNPLEGVGRIEFYPVETPPAGYLTCHGQAVSRTVYADLFAVIGTAYGPGNGSTTFNLPDNQGVFLRGWNPNDSVLLGDLQDAQVGSHIHYTGEFTQSSDDNWRAIYKPGGTDGASHTKRQVTGESTASSTTGQLNNFATGTGRQVEEGTTENRPINRHFLSIIKF